MLGSSALLEQGLSLDLSELELDQLVVWGETSQRSKSLATLCLTAVVDKPSRREGHFERLATIIGGQMSERLSRLTEHHTTEKNESGKKLEAERHQPGSVFLGGAGATNVVGAVVDPEGDHDTGSDGKLLQADQSTSDFWWSAFGVVHWHDHGQGTDTHT